jgi:phosphate starvation-inducible PhoH-like protein
MCALLACAALARGPSLGAQPAPDAARVAFEQGMVALQGNRFRDAVEALEAGKVGRIVLSRPAVDAGESIGFLPGDMEDKLAPYLRPLYDALSDRLTMKRVRAMMAEGVIEIAPVGFMRGRTLNNAFVVIDEAQNCTYVQLKMLLTRLGWHSTMVVTGDPAQSDLLPELSGLAPVAERLQAVGNISVVRLADRDIVRHPLVAEMLGVL